MVLHGYQQEWSDLSSMPKIAPLVLISLLQAMLTEYRQPRAGGAVLRLPENKLSWLNEVV
jgi:hypothetical protein